MLLDYFLNWGARNFAVIPSFDLIILYNHTFLHMLLLDIC